MKVRTFGMTILALVGAIPLLIGGELMVRRAERTALSDIRTADGRAATLIATRIEAHVEAQVAILRSIGASLAPGVLLSADQRREIARHMWLMYPQIVSLSVIGPDGCHELTTSRLDDALTDRCSDPDAKAALIASRTGVYQGPIALSTEALPVMTLAVPLVVAGERVGTSLAVMDMSSLWDVLHALSAGRTGFPRLVARDGTLIGHGNPDEQSRVFSPDKDPHLAQARAAGATGLRYRDAQGRAVFAVAHDLDTLPWTVIFEEPVRDAFAPAVAMKNDLYLLIVAAVLLALLAGVLLGRGPVRDLEAMRRQVGEFARGNLAARAPTGRVGLGELAALAAALNDMADRTVHLQEDRERRERLTTFARIAAGLAHDLKTPIHAIRDACERAVEAASREEAIRANRTALDRDLPRLYRYVDDLGRLSNRQTIHVDPRPLDAVALAEEIAGEARGAARWSGVSFDVRGTTAPFHADRDLLRRALMNWWEMAPTRVSRTARPAGSSPSRSAMRRARRSCLPCVTPRRGSAPSDSRRSCATTSAPTSARMASAWDSPSRSRSRTRTAVCSRPRARLASAACFGCASRARRRRVM